jgi:Ca2+-binding EF-hand superfamily protein
MLRFGLTAFAISLLALPVVSTARAADNASAFVAKWDTDHDGTLDLAEVNKAADALFDKLDVDHDGTLDRKELGRRVTRTEFKAADKDHDGTLDKAEFETIVDKRFHAANPDADTTIEASELTTRSGKRLLLLLQ